MASSAYVNVAVKGLKEVYDNAQNLSIMEYKDSRLFDLKDTNEYSEDFTATNGLAGFEKLAEGQTPPTLVLDKGYSVNLKEDRFGGSIVLTDTMLRQSESNQEKIKGFLDTQRNSLITEGTHKFLTDIFAMYNNAFDSTADTLAPDGVEVCGTHTWLAGGTESFTNKGTEVLDADAVATMEEYAGAFTDAQGKPLPQDFDTIVVKKGSAAAREAKKLFLEEIKPTKVADINIYQGGNYAVIETPYITNPLHWFAFSSRRQHPFYVGVGRTPKIQEGIKQNNGDMRYNSIGFWKRGLPNLPFNFYGSNGTT